MQVHMYIISKHGSIVDTHHRNGCMALRIHYIMLAYERPLLKTSQVYFCPSLLLDFTLLDLILGLIRIIMCICWDMKDPCGIWSLWGCGTAPIIVILLSYLKASSL